MNKQEPEDRRYTTREAAEILDCAYSTLTWALRKMQIPKDGNSYVITNSTLEKLRRGGL